VTESADMERVQRFAGPHRGSDNQDQLDLVSLMEQGYVRARFGDIPVLITPELAAQIRACRAEQS
jgi:hypothetical protein